MIHLIPYRIPCRFYIHLALSLVPRANLDWLLLFHQRECLKCKGHGLAVSCVKWLSLSHSFVFEVVQIAARAKQPVHWFLGGKGLGIQQGTSAWVGSPKYGDSLKVDGSWIVFFGLLINIIKMLIWIFCLLSYWGFSWFVKFNDHIGVPK